MLRCGVIVHCNIQPNVYTAIRLRRVGLGCTGFVLKFIDACPGQAEAVVPKRFKTGLGCNGLGPLPLWLFVLCQLGFIISFVRLILVPAVFFLAGVFRMLSNLMQCLLNWHFKRLTTVCPVSYLLRSAVCT